MTLQSSNVFGNGSDVPVELRLPLRYRVGFAFSSVCLIAFGLYLAQLNSDAKYPEAATKFNIVICGVGAFVMFVGCNRRRFWAVISTAWSVVTVGTLALVVIAHDNRLVSIGTSGPYLLTGATAIAAVSIAFIGSRDHPCSVTPKQNAN
jgi:hypothetical protein